MFAMTGNFEKKTKIWFIFNIKRLLQAKIISTYWESRNAWLILWMLIWDKSQIPKPDYQKFIDSWLVHLIAVSGWNIIMLTIFLSFILFFLPFYFRNFIILLSIILYSLVCWMDSSVTRAVLFGWLGMIALFVGRETNFWRSVYIFFVLMLLINPYFLLYDLWFLLSFGAIIGIRIFNEKKNIEEKKEIPVVKPNAVMTEKKRFLTAFEMTVKRVYNSYIKPSIWANIWILPIIIFFMWKINLVWFITNLFVLPIVPFVMIYGFISIFLYWLIPRRGFIYIQELLIDYIYKISEIGSDYWIYLLVNDYKIKYLILILFIIWLIIYMTKNKIIGYCDSNTKSRANKTIKHKVKKSN
jgi:competence protein ComEC